MTKVRNIQHLLADKNCITLWGKNLTERESDTKMKSATELMFEKKNIDNFCDIVHYDWCYFIMLSIM